MDATFRLFSRARRLAIEDSARGDAREWEPSRPKIHSQLRATLDRECPGLVGHASSRVLSMIADPEPVRGRLPMKICRVRLGAGQYFVFTLTRQSGYDGGDPRDCDGYEKCWFVWSIRPERKGQSEASVTNPRPSLKRLLPL